MEKEENIIKGYANQIDYARTEIEKIRKKRIKGIITSCLALVGGFLGGIGLAATILPYFGIGLSICSIIINIPILICEASQATKTQNEWKDFIKAAKLNEKAQEFNKDESKLIEELVKRPKLIELTSLGINANLLEQDYNLIKDAAFTPKVAEYIKEIDNLEAFDIVDGEVIGKPLELEVADKKSSKKEKKQKIKQKERTGGFKE